MAKTNIPSFESKGRFSGHETFPLRYGWLSKVYDAVSGNHSRRQRNVFSTDDAMVTFGVGKNMVSSMKYWALATSIIQEDDLGYQTTTFADTLLGPSGCDPYLEHPASLWLLHWKLCSTPIRTTTWYWAFNHLSSRTFDREGLTASICEYCSERGWTRISVGTIRRDVDCFLGTYVTDSGVEAGKVSEETLGSPLAELGLITSSGRRGSFEFQRGPKNSLPDAILIYAIAEFWARHSTVSSLPIEAISFEAGSPGKVFKLDEENLAERLSSIEITSRGVFRWTDTAGIRQVVRLRQHFNALKFVTDAYRRKVTRRVA